MCYYFINLCASFAYVFVHLCTVYAALRRLYGFCVRFCMSLRNVSGFAYVIWLLCTFVYDFLQCMQLVRMYTDLRRLYGFCGLSGLCVCIRLCVGCTTIAS